MKTKAIFIILAMVLTLASCKKDEPADVRDKFIGTWAGEQSFTYSNGTTDVADQSFTITKAPAANKIFVTDYNQVQYTATVTGDRYVYDQYTNTESSPGYYYSIIQLGNGTVYDNQIVENGTFFITLNDQNYTGMWSSTLYRK